MRENTVKTSLRGGESVIGTMIQEIDSPAVVMLMANAGFDFIFIDMEHGPYDLGKTAEMIRVGRLAGIVPLVRVPESKYHLIARVLDAGAMGVMVPRVETREQVEEAVAAVRYPPAGKRGYSTGKGSSDYQAVSMAEFVRHSDENLLTVMQIERKTAIEKIDQLLSVPGVDVALIGPADLTLSLGASSPQDASVQSAIHEVIEAGKRHQVATGIHLRDIDGLKKWQSRGMTMLTCSTELDFIRQGASAAVNSLRVADYITVKLSQSDKSN